MSKPAPSAVDLRERERRARAWRQFRRDNLLNQSELAKVLGICLRSVQSVESSSTTPLVKTLRAFQAVQTKFAGKRAA